MLDVVGMLPHPIFGLADLLNAAWYASEGRPSLAALSLSAAVPLAGNKAIVAKWAKEMEKLPAAVQAMKLAKGAPNTGRAYNSAYKFQELFGTNKLVRGALWKGLARYFDDPDHPFGQNKEEIMKELDKLNGDPSQPENQEKIFQLANHMNKKNTYVNNYEEFMKRAEMGWYDADVMRPPITPNVIDKHSKETVKAHVPSAPSADQGAESPPPSEDAGSYTQLRDFMASDASDEEKGMAGDHFTDLLVNSLSNDI